jgi:hypothetical protein
MTKRKIGRPRIDPRDTSQAVTVRLPTKQYDALCKDAQARAESLPAAIRRALKRRPPFRT